MRSIIAIALPVLVVSLFVIEALRTKAKSKGGYKIYSASRGFQALYLITIPLLLYGTVVNYFQHPSERWVSAILLGTSLFALYFYPPTLIVGFQEISSIKWFGLKRTTMKWEDVEAIYAVPEQQAIVVQDKQQNQISHGIFNVDRTGFVNQISRLPQAASGRINLRL